MTTGGTRDIPEAASDITVILMTDPKTPLPRGYEIARALEETGQTGSE